MKHFYFPLMLVSVVLLSVGKPQKIKVKSPLFKGYQFIPAGRLDLDVRAAEVESFFISSTEISNAQYRKFLRHLQQENITQNFTLAQLDTSKWLSFLSEPFANYYHSHPAYDNYPCVNMSYEGAVLYCKWLQHELEKADKRYDFEVKLPTKEQWMYAATAGKTNRTYSWEGTGLFAKGYALCNFRNLGAGAIHNDAATGNDVVVQSGNVGQLNANADITAPVVSYLPNEFGLYNVCGNVAEMIDEKGVAMGGSFLSPGYDVRIKSESSYAAPSPTVGFRPIIMVKTK